MDQPGKAANPARGQLNREKNIPLSPCLPENLVSGDGFSLPVPRQPAHLHTQAEPGAYLRDSKHANLRNQHPERSSTATVAVVVGIWQEGQHQKSIACACGASRCAELPHASFGHGYA